MAFADRPAAAPIETGIALLNAYEVGSLVVTFVTVVPKKDAVSLKEREISTLARLDSISIADRSYAASWGKPTTDGSYRKIEWK